MDALGNLYIADAGNRSIRKITPAGVVTTFVDGSNGQLGSPRGVVVDNIGTLYVTDYTGHVIYRVTSAGVVSKLAGTAPVPGSTDGTTAIALFNGPSALAIDSAGNLYVADTASNTVRKIASGNVTTLAGQAGRSSSVDGKGSAARFEDPYAVAVDTSGNVYVADATDHSIRKITADGTVTTFAGRSGTFGSSDGTGTAALFKTPQGIATDSLGNVYVADTGNATVRKITSAGVVSTIAGTAGTPGNLDATGAAARFNSPFGIAVDGVGNVYVVDSNLNTVRKITPAGVVTTLAGAANQTGLVDGTGTAARFTVPFDITVDAAGNLYVCDHGNHAIRKVTPAGVVSTLAGSGLPGLADGNGAAAQFKFPAGISVDTAGNVYVADTDNQVLRKISPAGVVTTIAGSGIGSADGVGTLATFYNPKDVAVESNGNVYVVDRGNHTIRKGSVAASTASVAVGAGWNLLGNGSTAALSFSDAALFGDASKVASVWKWRNTSGKWALYSPSMTAQELTTYAAGQGYEVLASLDTGEGFWVNAKAAFSVSLPSASTVSLATVQTGLKSGWNLVSVGAIGNASDITATSVWAWDNARSAWYFYASDLSASGGLAPYLQSNGYLSFATDGKTFGLGTGFWVKRP
jgi:sugar lactone lactonase YvrE